jgi:hypothetical protein
MRTKIAKNPHLSELNRLQKVEYQKVLTAKPAEVAEFLT